MKTKILTLIGLVLCLTMFTFAQDDKMKEDKMMKKDNKMMKNATPEQAVMFLERSAWKALEEKRYDDFAKLFTDDYQGFYPDQVSDKTSEIAAVKQVTFKNVMFSDMKVQFADKDAAIVTSIVKFDIVLPDGKTVTDNVRTTSVWVKRGKNWMTTYHSHFPLMTADKMDKMDKM